MAALGLLAVAVGWVACFAQEPWHTLALDGFALWAMVLLGLCAVDLSRAGARDEPAVRERTLRRVKYAGGFVLAAVMLSGRQPWGAISAGIFDVLLVVWVVRACMGGRGRGL